MSEEEIVLYTKVDGVARIVINRPSKLNALNKAVMHGIHRAIVNAEGDPEVRCVLLTGAGDAFSSGGDLEMAKQFATQSPPEIYQSAMEGFEAILKIYSLAKPVITAVNGVALGGGCSLALIGDVILASDRARFGMIFSRLNGVPDLGGTYLLPRLVGLIRAKELIFSGRTFSAQEALSYGMVSEVIPHDQFEATIMDKAREMARWPTQAIGLAKNLLHRSMTGCDLATIIELEAKTQLMLSNSKETREAIQAFLEKRKL